MYVPNIHYNFSRMIDHNIRIQPYQTALSLENKTQKLESDTRKRCEERLKVLKG